MNGARLNTRGAGMRRSGDSGSRAFTLMEMVTSCAVLSLIMLSLGYGLKLALVSTGNGAQQATGSLDAADAVERITDDLNEAITFTENTSEAVTFTVPDRGTDAVADKIRYKWWPTAGSVTFPGTGDLIGGLLGVLGDGSGGTVIPVPAFTLTRELNDGVPAVLARDVRQFSLSYLYRTLSPAATSAGAGTGDRLLWSHEPLIGTPKDYTLDASRWMGETFLPSSSLPLGTTSWSITRVALLLKADTTYDGLLRVSVRPVSTASSSLNWPTSTMLESVLVSEVSLGDGYQWVEVPFTTLNNLGVGTKYAIVVQGVTGTAGSPIGTVSWMQAGTPIAASTWMVQTSTGGGSWNPTLTNSLRYRIYGKTTP